jgi:type I restriction enzyme S subunit
MGQSPPGETYNTRGDGLPFFQGKAEFGDVFPIAVKWCTSPLKVAEAGDILLSVRAPVGPTNVAKSKSCIGRGLAAIRSDERLVLPSFLRYYFIAFELIISRMGAGSTFDAVGRDIIENLEVPVPPLTQQERIARILDEADQLQHLRAEADRRTTGLIPALFADMFNEKIASFEKWPIGTLRSFGVAIRYGLGQPPEEDTDGVPLIRATNIKRGSIVTEGLVRVRKDRIPTGRNPFLQKGEVLVVRSGAYTGDVGYISTEWVLTPSERVDSHFLTWFLLSSAIQSRYFSHEKNRAAQPHLNATQVENTPCILPPFTRQREFASYVEEVHALQLMQVDSRPRLHDLFQSLLYRAFEGRL